MERAQIPPRAAYSYAARRGSNSLLLLTIAALLNACGGGADEAGLGGGSAAIACVTGPIPTVLTWNAVAGAAGYNVYFRTSSGAFSTLQGAVPNTTLTVTTGLNSGTTYYFSVTAYDSSSPPLESSISNEVCKTIS